MGRVVASVGGGIMNSMKMKTLLKGLLILTGLLAALIAALVVWAYMPVAKFEPVAYEPTEPDYWPTEGWRRATPEERGMSSETLVDTMAFYEESRKQDDELYIESMTVVRDGYIVADFYTNPLYPRDELHVMHSATKSIVSALVGIAIDRGHIESVDALVVEIFSNREIKNLDERTQAMTIRDLLSMETGLHSRDSYIYQYEGLFEMQRTDDWLQYALDLRMAAQPGERFDYSNISTFLLSAVLMEATGVETLEFARRTLFAPLGIEDIIWEWNSEGYPMAWARMWLKPNDMAKIGLLYLQQGEWEGEQIIPADWVRESLTPFAYQKNAVAILNADMSRDGEASTRNWVAQRFFRPFADGYGYQWWLHRDGHYSAVGTSGQFIVVAPEQNLIFVVTAKSSGLAQFFPASLFFDFVLPAIESDEPLPANRTALAELAALAGPPEYSREPTEVPALPPIATAVSGVTYVMEANPFNTNNLRFVFDAEKDFAELSYTARESWKIDCKIGLDGVHRFAESKPSRVAAVGEWISPNTFHVETEILGYSSFDTWECRSPDSFRAGPCARTLGPALVNGLELLSD